MVVAEPDDMDSEIAHLEPDLAICSRLTETVQTRPIAWMLLYPGGDSRAVVSISGSAVEHTDVDVHLLLSVVDQTELLKHR